MSVEIDIAADRRTPCIFDLPIVGPNYSGAAVRLEVRNRPGDTGEPVIPAITSAPPGTQGVSIAYDPEYPIMTDGVLTPLPASILLFQIDEATLESVEVGTPSDVPLELFYDAHLTPLGDSKRIVMHGRFILNPGVTI